MTYWNDPREDNYSFDQSFQWNAAMSNLNGMPVRTYKEPSSIIKLTEGGDTPEPDALNFYMPEGGTISLNKTGSPTVVELEYSLDRGKTWTVWQPNSNGNRSLTLKAGQRVYVRNTSVTQTLFSILADDYYSFAFTSIVEARGNTNSLLCRNAESVTTSTSFCFRYLFYECSSLVSAPELPSTILSESCYQSMFNGCSSLVSAPELPSTILEPYCYYSMFYRCSSLVSAPELPSTILSESCYRSIFNTCPSLAEIRTHMTNISAINCLYRWVVNVSPTGDFYCPAELTIPTGINGIPSGWTRHDLQTE